MRASILLVLLGGCFRDAPSTSTPPPPPVPEHRHPADAAVATDEVPDENTGFDLYVSPAPPSWTLDGEVRTDRLPVRIRGIRSGAHVVGIDAVPGFQGERRTIDVQAGSSSVVHIDLKRASSPTP